MRTILILKTLFLTLILTALGTTAQAVDMTGTWTGDETCKCFNDVVGKSTEKYTDEVIRVSQDGTDLNIEAYGELFNGNVINDPKRDRKGEASLISCNADPADNASFGELGRAKVWAKSNGGGKMVIDSLWNSQENELCHCRARFRRVDTVDPEISDCSEARASRIDSWHDAMLGMPPDSDGCHEVTHPSMEWEEVGCDEAKILDSASGRRVTDAAHRSPSTRSVGFEKDFVVKNAGGYFTQVTGSFENVIGVTSITDHAGTNESPDKWTLQLNTNVFDTPKCEGLGFCFGWQQAIYAHQGQESQGELFILSWLIAVISEENGRTCPPGWKASATGHFLDDGCYRSSPVKSVPAVAVSELEHVHLTKVSGLKGEFVILRVDDTLHANAAPAEFQVDDEMLGLYKNWKSAEFNVFGNDFTWSEAVFSDNSSINVTLTVDSYEGGHITCERGGVNDASNNLTLRGECSQVAHSTTPTYHFTQDNFPREVVEYSGSCSVPSTPCNFMTTECRAYMKCRCKADELPLILGTGQYRNDYSNLCKYAVNWD